MYVCICQSVSDRDIQHEVDQGARTLGELVQRTQLGTCCGRCVPMAKQTLNEALAVRVEFAEPDLALAV